MKKILFDILFVICHLIASFCSYCLVALFYDPFYPHPYWALLMGMLIFLPLSCTYLMLMRKKLISLIPSIVCFVSNLLFQGYPALILLAFRTKFFTLSPPELVHDFALIVLIAQCSVFISTLRCRQKKERPVKEFKSPPYVITRTQHIRHSVWYTLFKKHYCPSCSAKLHLIKKTKLIASNAPGANNYSGILSEVSPEENIRFIWNEFQCPNCKADFTIENMKKIERKTGDGSLS